MQLGLINRRHENIPRFFIILTQLSTHLFFNSILFSRNILPKTELAGRSSSPIMNHLTSFATSNMQQQMQQQQQHQKAQQQFIEQQHQIFQQNEHLNGNHQVGRQGAIKDVKSIIEAFRQKNPERAPRRGRRLKPPVGNCDGTVTSPRSSDGILTRQSVEGRVSELGLLLAKDRNSRPSSADSSPGNSNLASTNNNISTANANITFNDMLMQYAKLNERPPEMLSNASMVRQQSGYPEVTLHPVNSQANTALHQSDNLQSNSLLHGILTKVNILAQLFEIFIQIFIKNFLLIFFYSRTHGHLLSTTTHFHQH